MTTYSPRVHLQKRFRKALIRSGELSNAGGGRKGPIFVWETYKISDHLVIIGLIQISHLLLTLLALGKGYLRCVSYHFRLGICLALYFFFSVSSEDEKLVLLTFSCSVIGLLSSLKGDFFSFNRS